MRFADLTPALGDVLKSARDGTGASAALRRAITLRPTEAPAHVASAASRSPPSSWRAPTDVQTPASCSACAFDAFEAYAPAHYQMGRALQRLGRDAAARAAFARAQTTESEHGPATRRPAAAAERDAISAIGDCHPPARSGITECSTGEPKPSLSNRLRVKGGD